MGLGENETRPERRQKNQLGIREYLQTGMRTVVRAGVRVGERDRERKRVIQKSDSYLNRSHFSALPLSLSLLPCPVSPPWAKPQAMDFQDTAGAVFAWMREPPLFMPSFFPDYHAESNPQCDRPWDCLEVTHVVLVSTLWHAYVCLPTSSLLVHVLAWFLGRQIVNVAHRQRGSTPFPSWTYNGREKLGRWTQRFSA